jgi:hypothetical protein
MYNTNSAHHANQYNVQSACVHCQGIVDHERWCRTNDPRVSYAYQVARDGSKLTLGDTLILHSLGVAWPESIHSVSLAAKGR